MNTMLQVRSLKEAQEDFEWYPTTRRMIETIIYDLSQKGKERYRSPHDSFSLLDIGAGNGSVFQIIDLLNPKILSEKFAIEKSSILRNQLPHDVSVIGTDFHQQTLIDKSVDVIFCNPPYSEYEQWMNKIIKESNASFIYLIVPSRWKISKGIIDNISKVFVIKDLSVSNFSEYLESGQDMIQILDTFSFEDSEFRKARAEVDIIRISCSSRADAFSLWFDEHFSINADKYEKPKYENKKLKIDPNDLVKGQNIIERLEELYRNDFDELLATYKKLESIDPELLRELGVTVSAVKDGLKSKISGLKNLYWQELFDNMSTITDRLTSESRKSMLSKLSKHVSIDFTADNAYSVVLWAIKNANRYFDEQLMSVYYNLSHPDNVRNYKSNLKLVEDGWRYQRKTSKTHYYLDYRLIQEYHTCFNPQSFGGYDYPKGLSNYVHDQINDLITVAKNLGFSVEESTFDFEWEPGSKFVFHLNNGDIFMTAKAYKKGTVHLQINENFMKKFNIEAGRLNGWVKSPQEASEEMDIAITDVVNNFKTNLVLLSTDIKLIGA